MSDLIELLTELERDLEPRELEAWFTAFEMEELEGPTSVGVGLLCRGEAVE